MDLGDVGVMFRQTVRANRCEINAAVVEIRARFRVELTTLNEPIDQSASHNTQSDFTAQEELSQVVGHFLDFADDRIHVFLARKRRKRVLHRLIEGDPPTEQEPTGRFGEVRERVAKILHGSPLNKSS